MDMGFFLSDKKILKLDSDYGCTIPNIPKTTEFVHLIKRVNFMPCELYLTVSFFQSGDVNLRIKTGSDTGVHALKW